MDFPNFLDEPRWTPHFKPEKERDFSKRHQTLRNVHGIKYMEMYLTLLVWVNAPMNKLSRRQPAYIITCLKPCSAETSIFVIKTPKEE